MSAALVVVKPVVVTDAMLTGTNVPETDHAAWNSGTTYAQGNRVIVTSSGVHKIYESLAPANLNKSPGTEPTWWIEVSATNRWKVFDLSNSSQTAQATSIWYEVTPGQSVNAVAVLNLVNVQTVRYRLTDPSFGVVYDETYTLNSIPSAASWWAWFFGGRSEQPQHVALDLPSYPNATLRVDLTGGAQMAVGVLLLGQQKSIGLGVQQGARVGIQDYSRKETSDFGDTVLVQRAFAKRASFQMLLANSELDNAQALLTSVRALPCLWIGSSRYAATVVYGFFKEFDIAISYADYADCSIDLEGLT